MARSDEQATTVGRRMPGDIGVRDDVTHLVLAGLGNSSPGHWQRNWAEMLPNCTWLEHGSWDEPDEQAWLSDLEECLAAQQRPVVAITHSLGCSLLASWWSRHHDDAHQPVIAALVVAPPDATRDDFPPEVTGFDELRLVPFDFPATVVYSTDDQYSETGPAVDFGRGVGARLVNLGAKGHINSATSLGDWPEGQQLFRELLQRLPADPATAEGAGTQPGPSRGTP